MSTGALATCWRAYAATKELASQTPAERQEARRNFYAGACSMLELLKAGAELPDDQRELFKSTLRCEMAMHMATVGTTLEGKV